MAALTTLREDGIAPPVIQGGSYVTDGCGLGSITKPEILNVRRSSLKMSLRYRSISLALRLQSQILRLAVGVEIPVTRLRASYSDCRVSHPPYSRRAPIGGRGRSLGVQTLSLLTGGVPSHPVGRGGMGPTKIFPQLTHPAGLS